MAKLTDSIGTFQTGDLVFVRYPPKPGGQPIHVTVFLDASSRRGPGYLHAGDQLEKDTLDHYADYQEHGGYLHVCTTDTELRAAVAEVAAIFAMDAPRTPYGSYPNSADVARIAGKPVVSPRASRFTGMIGTRDVSEIPFELPALVRLLKWTHRAITSAPLSEHRGITCAAFSAICHQVAGMRAFLEETGVAFKPATVLDAVRRLDTLTVSKEDLRKNLELIGRDDTTGKTVFKGQALPANSNRTLSDKGREEFKALTQTTVEGKSTMLPWVATALNTIGKKASELSAVERSWLVVQVQFLGISEYAVKPLSDIIHPDFFFDAKYVSSPALAAALRASGGWKSTEFTAY